MNATEKIIDDHMRMLSALGAIVEAGRMSNEPRAMYMVEIAKRAIAHVAPERKA